MKLPTPEEESDAKQLLSHARLFQLSPDQQKLKNLITDQVGVLAEKKNADFEVLNKNIKSFLSFFECFNVAEKLLLPLALEDFWVKCLEKHSKILNLENKGGEKPQKKQPGLLPLVQLLGIYYFVVGVQELYEIAFSPALTWEALLKNNNLTKALIYQSFHAIRFVYKHYLNFIQNAKSDMTKAKIKHMHASFNQYLDGAIKHNVLPISLLRAELNVATFHALDRFGLNFKSDDPENDTPFMVSLLLDALKSLALAERLIQGLEDEAPGSKRAQFFKTQMLNAYGTVQLTYKAGIFLLPLLTELPKTNPLQDYLDFVKSLAQRFCNVHLAEIKPDIEQQAQKLLEEIAAMDFAGDVSLNEKELLHILGEKLAPRILDLDPNALQDLLHNLDPLRIAQPSLKAAKSM